MILIGTAGWNYPGWRGIVYRNLYTPEELNKQKELVKAVSEKAKKTFVSYNNHPNGRAAVNALQTIALAGISSPTISALGSSGGIPS